MINIIKAVLETAETNDFSLKSIDPKEKSYTEETDNMLYNEAYKKACIGIKTCYDAHEKLYREVISNIRYECERIQINQDMEKNVELHTISINPQIDFNVMKLLEDFFSSTNMNEFNSSDEFLTTLQANVISQMGDTPITKEGYIGPVVNLPIKGTLVAENLNMVERNIMNASDELYTVYEFIGKKITEEKNPMCLEAYARIFEYCAKLISYEIGAYGVAALELLQVGKNIMPMNESAILNEGIVGNIFKGILISPIVLTAGFITWFSIYMKIQDIKFDKEAKKEKDKLVLVQKSKNIIMKNSDKLLDEAKFAKYNPDAILAMKDLSELLNKYNKKLKDIDDRFKNIKTIDEYKKKKESFKKEYNDLYESVVKEYKSINDKYKNSKKEWITSLDIIKPLKDYLHLINKDTYYRNLDGDDWDESVKFLFDNRFNNEYSDDEWDDIFHEAYNVFSTFPEYEITDIGDFKFPFSMIKIQFTGDTLNESAVLLEATNEENARKYIDEIDKLIDEVRAFYDKFEYKEIIIPRKKKEHKMFEYVLGALERKYTLRIPIYKVEGASEDVKDIVEHKFIDKLESITKKYPNFVIMSPNWENDSDMFIYITLREPFGEKEDRKDREGQVQNESTEDPNYAINRKEESSDSDLLNEGFNPERRIEHRSDKNSVNNKVHQEILAKIDRLPNTSAEIKKASNPQKDTEFEQKVISETKKRVKYPISGADYLKLKEEVRKELISQNESTEDPNYAINRKIEHLQKKIEMNEMVQDRYIEKNGYENKSLAEEHDKMCDQMEELCRQRREAKNTENKAQDTLNEGIKDKLKDIIDSRKPKVFTDEELKDMGIKTFEPETFEPETFKHEAINEASLSKSEKDALEDYEFGLPEKRTYPLNDEVRIKQAIKFFGYCRASDKKTLAKNIVRRIIELDLVGIVTITEKHPNRRFFPEWMLNTCKPILERKGNKYTIYVDGERVDYGTLEDHSTDDGGRIVVVNESGMLF